jgi:hypothetical protein
MLYSLVSIHRFIVALKTAHTHTRTTHSFVRFVCLTFGRSHRSVQPWAAVSAVVCCYAGWTRSRGSSTCAARMSTTIRVSLEVLNATTLARWHSRLLSPSTSTTLILPSLLLVRPCDPSRRGSLCRSRAALPGCPGQPGSARGHQAVQRCPRGAARTRTPAAGAERCVCVCVCVCVWSPLLFDICSRLVHVTILAFLLTQQTRSGSVRSAIRQSPRLCTLCR